jgi:N-acetylneuraminate synthase
MSTVKVGNKLLGEGQPCYVIAEIGINHNGDIDLAKRLISVAVAAGCDAVKFQKRTVDIVYTAAELSTPRPNPFGDTNGDLKRGLEFGEEEYDEIAAFCKSVKIPWLVSPWDEPSVDFMEKYDTPVYKIAVEVLGKEDLILMHTTSTYPAKYEQLNLRAIPTMAERYGVPVGYSGHETGIPTTVAAAVLGACVVERHITMDRAMWGSDQSASLEPNGIGRLVRDIRLCEQSMGDGIKRVYAEEVPVMKKLRRVGAAV